jgi:hypothetical protein
VKPVMRLVMTKPLRPRLEEEFVAVILGSPFLASAS